MQRRRPQSGSAVVEKTQLAQKRVIVVAPFHDDEGAAPNRPESAPNALQSPKKKSKTVAFPKVTSSAGKGEKPLDMEMADADNSRPEEPLEASCDKCSHGRGRTGG